MDNLRTAAKEIFRTFQQQGQESVYAVHCCGRLYLGVAPATRCRTCELTPQNVKIGSEAEIDQMVFSDPDS